MAYLHYPFSVYLFFFFATVLAAALLHPSWNSVGPRRERCTAFMQCFSCRRQNGAEWRAPSRKGTSICLISVESFYEWYSMFSCFEMLNSLPFLRVVRPLLLVLTRQIPMGYNSCAAGKQTNDNVREEESSSNKVRWLDEPSVCQNQNSPLVSVLTFVLLLQGCRLVWSYSSQHKMIGLELFKMDL